MLVFHLTVVLAVVAILFGGRKISDLFNNFRGGGGGPQPFPATGAVESSRGAANPKESRPVGSELYLKCVVGGLMGLILVFGVYFLASVIAVEMIGFTIGFSSPISWLVFAFVVFGAGFLWELRRLAK